MRVAVINIILTFLLVLCYVAAAPMCPIQTSTTAPQNCTYGTVADWCRNIVCARGPGEECREDDWWENECALGTYCACGYCTGCLMTLQCHSSAFC